MVRSPLDGYTEVFARYGDTVRVPVGPRHARFLLSRPEHAEHVLATHQDNYVKPVTSNGLRALIGDGLFTREGDDWRRHRRLVQPVFSRRDVTDFGPAIADATRHMLGAWAELPDGARFDLTAQMSALALNIVGRALFSADMADHIDWISRVTAVGQRVALVTGFMTLPWGSRSAGAVKALAKRVGGTPDGIEGLAGRLIAARREEPRKQRIGVANRGYPDQNPAMQQDLLDVLLTARTEDGSPLTDEEISAEIGTFLLAGYETSANALSWSLALLSAFPSARADLEHEVDSVLGGREPEPSDMASLPWTRAVINETLRLYPPAWAIERSAIADDAVAGLRIPAGSHVMIPPFLIHRHPAFWPSPGRFDPARFLPVSRSVPATASPGRPTEWPRYAYIPFGAGRRACVGQAFAELEMMLVLVAITQRYRLTLTTVNIPKPAARVTLRPAGGLPMRLTRR